MNMQRSRKVGLALFALAVLALAPAAFARTHVSIGLGFYGPGYSVGVSSCHHCGWGHGYRYRTGFYGSWYAPVYYAPAPVYYAPPRVVYYDEPVVVERVYETRRVYRYDDRYDGRYDRHYRRDDGRRGHYYDDDDGD